MINFDLLNSQPIFTMKYSPFLISALLLFSCGGESQETNETASDTTEKSTEESTSETIEPLGDPCKLSAEEIAAIIGWEDYFEGKSNSMNTEARLACEYGTKLDGALTIMFQRYDSDPASDYLERSYDGMLEMEDDKLTFQEVSTEIGDQMIYNFGPEGPNYVYKIQWRFGNHTGHSISLRAVNERDSEETKNQLLAIAKKL